MSLVGRKVRFKGIRVNGKSGGCFDDLFIFSDRIVYSKKKWKPRKFEYKSGTLWKYSQSVGPAFRGAVTHPGASKEKKCYADI